MDPFTWGDLPGVTECESISAVHSMILSESWVVLPPIGLGGAPFVSKILVVAVSGRPPSS
jgi:hypothetical protein